MAISKVIYGSTTLIDLTADTVTADKLLKGIKAHGADGESVVGTCEYDANTQDATATAAEILSGKTAYNKANKVTGTMANNGAVEGTIKFKAAKYAIPQGYHDGSGYAWVDPTEQTKLVPSNIRKGISILGVVGEMSGTEDVNAQIKHVTPSTVGLEIVPDEGYNYLSQVLVSAIPYAESDNSAGGKTVVIG